MRNPLEIDALYKSVPRFAQWVGCSVSEARWNRYTSRLAAFKEKSPELFREAREAVKRATAIDTGALEGLYEVDRGWTITVAMETATWEARIGEKGEAAKALIESQLRAYDYVLDFATQAVPIAEAWIRKLHEEICSGQPTYRVLTEAGWQNQTLPLGQYKHHPNHVERRDGQIHAYAPVDQTPSEMQIFVEELRSPAFQSAHPVLQTAYSHYGLVWIHPFADGNGRVARALASAFTYRAASIPLMVLADKKHEYLDSLFSADLGNCQSFVDFVLDRIVDATELVGDSLGAAQAPAVDEVLQRLVEVYKTRGGYTHQQVDEAGARLLGLFHKTMQELSSTKSQGLSGQLTMSFGMGSMTFRKTANFRGSRPDQTDFVQLNLQTPFPAQAQWQSIYFLKLPVDCDKEDYIVIQSDRRSEASIEVRMPDLFPDVSVAARLRLRMFAERCFAQDLSAILRTAQSNLEKQ